MKLAEFAFVNQQLAGMVRNGRPLEGALRQLCQDMAAGQLKAELEALEKDLSTGIPLAKAIAARDLPPFYKRTLQIGAQANDLPGILLLLANYYNRLGITWDKVKTAMFYPGIVLLFASFVSLGLATIMSRMQETLFVPDTQYATTGYPAFVLFVWAPVFALIALLITVTACSWIGPVRDRIKWLLPVSRNTVIAQFAASLGLLLRRGYPLGDATRFMHELEGDSILGREMKRWSQRIESGALCYSAVGEKNRILPPMFVWMLEQEADNLPAGLDRAADMYSQRAEHQTDLLMKAIAPIGLLALGLIVFFQIYPAIWWLTQWLNVVEAL
jgi:type II secretory pathway component PulF